jgi:hypothetical protein
LTVRCFYVVQKQKGVADAMIKAAFRNDMALSV